MGERRKAREHALQLLYQAEVNPEGKVDYEDLLEKSASLGAEGKEFILKLTQGTLEKKSEIDQLIKNFVKNWDMSRLSVIDRNIIRLGVYEMLFFSLSSGSSPTIPFAVTINEAVEIAKSYSTPESGKFVNGVLDQIRKEYFAHPKS